MTDFLLLCLFIAQILTIISIWIKSNPDFSKEDEQVKKATQEMLDAENNLPPTEQ